MKHLRIIKITYTQLGAKHTFLQIIPVKLSNGHNFIETNANEIPVKLSNSIFRVSFMNKTIAK